ncbi:MAG: GNAT family N-acetyltransferase [Phycisphaerales bacterium]|nr:MAG: GNAT family N-acetyltransferase [Phycisphaerales bacterium]
MDQFAIEFALKADLEWLVRHDKHVDRAILEKKLIRQEVLVARSNDGIMGWLRYSLFWDSIPFINMLVVLENHRRRTVGSSLVQYFEAHMKEQGHSRVMTSTQSDESGQHFFRKVGYEDVGSLLLPPEPLEIMLMKRL